METRIKAMFASVRMPEKTARQIRESLAQEETEEIFMRKLDFQKRPKVVWPAVALGLLLVLAVLMPKAAPEETAPATTEVTTRSEETEAERLRKLQERHEKLADGDLQRTIARFESALDYTEGRVRYRILHGGQDVSVIYDQQAHTPFTDHVDGRVYFVANGESLDITEEFSEEEPFTYIYTDRMFMEHYIAIGGTAENPGWLEMVHTSWQEKPYSFVCGSGENTWNNAADARYGWETRAKEIFEEYDVHWPS